MCFCANTTKPQSIHVGNWARTCKTFQTGWFPRACSTTSPTGKVGRCKINVQLKRKEWPLTQQDADLVIGVSVVQDRNRRGIITNIYQFTNLRMVRTWDKLVFRMTSELVVSKHPVFKCSNIRQVGVLMRRWKGGGAGTHYLMFATMILAWKQLRLSLAAKQWILNSTSKKPR